MPKFEYKTEVLATVVSREDLRQAILLARASGETYADIAAAAGLSPQRIQQIAKGANGG